MRLVAQIHVHVSGSIIQREPTTWEKLKRTFGAQLDLSTDRVRVELEASAVVDQVRRALVRLGIGNALSLVIDQNVIFQDTDGKADDLPDLLIAMSEHASVFGRGFKELRFAAEHDEAGLHLIIETRAKTEHAATEPAAIISVGGRLRALEAKSGESAEQYKARVEPLTKDTTAFEAARLQFEAFVSKLENALAATMPEARVEQVRAEARLVRQTPKDLQQQNQVRDPAHRGYDPFVTYYPSPMGAMLDAMLITSFMHAMMPSPAIMIVNGAGAPLGSVQQVAENPERLDAEPKEEAQAGEENQGADDDYGGGNDDYGGGGGDYDSGGGDWGGGGDSGGGDSGGSFD